MGLRYAIALRFPAVLVRQAYGAPGNRESQNELWCSICVKLARTAIPKKARLYHHDTEEAGSRVHQDEQLLLAGQNGVDQRIGINMRYAVIRSPNPAKGSTLRRRRRRFCLRSASAILLRMEKQVTKGRCVGAKVPAMLTLELFIIIIVVHNLPLWQGGKGSGPPASGGGSPFLWGKRRSPHRCARHGVRHCPRSP